MAIVAGEVKGGIALSVLQVDSRPLLDKQPSARLVAIDAGVHQGCFATWGLCVKRCPLLDKQPSACFVTPETRFHQRRTALCIGQDEAGVAREEEADNSLVALLRRQGECRATHLALCIELRAGKQRLHRRPLACAARDHERSDLALFCRPSERRHVTRGCRSQPVRRFARLL
eukprot:645138-Prymnesium_polylepis.3